MAEKASAGVSNALTSSFSGADVVCIFGDTYIGECMSFTVGVNREAGPLYVMGRKEPIAIPKGKRGIGGSFILAQLGYDALLEYYQEIMGGGTAKDIWVRNDETVPAIAGSTQKLSTSAAAGTSQGNANLLNIDEQGNISAINSDLWANLESPNYADQMPPFNITVIGMNEQGKKMGFRVYGVTIINDGMAISIDELNIEKRYQFIAQAISKMQVINV
jgi:hypothetical protein